MKADPLGVLTGTHFLDGDHACCEGALAAGARFAAGYPITPSTEIVERFAARVPTVGGTFIQMEDELAASITLQGAVWGGAKAFTVTSGPGFSLMMEHIGYAAMTETPCVFVDVQRGGPSTGLPTLPAQADMMQARWGSHGDYEIIALCPNSPQECFDLTITAFNLAEEFRVPVMFMMDEVVGHMTEKVIIPPADEIEVTPRRHTRMPVDDYLPYGTNGDLVPEMAHAGEGYKFHVTGLTHDEHGYPNMTPPVQDKLVKRLQNKIRSAADGICLFEEDGLGDADIVVVAYGITSRVAQRAIDAARERDLRVGKLRLITAWPFPEKKIAELASHVKAFVVGEAGHVKLVTVAGVRHLRNHIAVGRVGLIVFHGLVGVFARRHFDLVGRRNHNFLRHVPDHLVHHEHHRHAEFFRQVESLDGQVETLLGRIRAERDDLVVAVRSPTRLHHVSLRRKCGQSSRGPASLHVDKHAGRLGHSGVADVLHHQREAWPRGYREGLGSTPYPALQRDRSGEFVLHLNECSTDCRDAGREALDYFRRGRDGISGSESRASGQCAFAAGMIAVEKVRARQNAMGICFHFAPPPACLALSCWTLVPLIAKSGQYMPQRSQPLHFSGCTTCGGW